MLRKRVFYCDYYPTLLLLQSGTGKISPEELYQVCIQFNLVVDDNLVNLIMEYCDADGDGQLNYAEFVNFLNYKDIMRSVEPPKG